MNSKQATVGYLKRDCVIKPGKDGKQGDEISKDAVGEQVFEDLALAGVLSSKPVAQKSEPETDSKKGSKGK